MRLAERSRQQLPLVPEQSGLVLTPPKLVKFLSLSLSSACLFGGRGLRCLRYRKSASSLRVLRNLLQQSRAINVNPTQSAQSRTVASRSDYLPRRWTSAWVRVYASSCDLVIMLNTVGCQHRTRPFVSQCCEPSVTNLNLCVQLPLDCLCMCSSCMKAGRRQEDWLHLPSHFWATVFECLTYKDIPILCTISSRQLPCTVYS